MGLGGCNQGAEGIAAGTVLEECVCVCVLCAWPSSRLSGECSELPRPAPQQTMGGLSQCLLTHCYTQEHHRQGGGVTSVPGRRHISPFPPAPALPVHSWAWASHPGEKSMAMPLPGHILVHL